MPALDESDSPIKGFELIHNPDGLYLRCRVIGYDCFFYRKIRRIIYLEEVMRIAAKHRAMCRRPVQMPPTIANLPFEVIRKFGGVDEA